MIGYFSLLFFILISIAIGNKLKFKTHAAGSSDINQDMKLYCKVRDSTDNGWSEWELLTTSNSNRFLGGRVDSFTNFDSYNSINGIALYIPFGESVVGWLLGRVYFDGVLLAQGFCGDISIDGNNCGSSVQNQVTQSECGSTDVRRYVKYIMDKPDTELGNKCNMLAFELSVANNANAIAIDTNQGDFGLPPHNSNFYFRLVNKQFDYLLYNNYDGNGIYPSNGKLYKEQFFQLKKTGTEYYLESLLTGDLVRFVCHAHEAVNFAYSGGTDDDYYYINSHLHNDIVLYMWAYKLKRTLSYVIASPIARGLWAFDYLFSHTNSLPTLSSSLKLDYMSHNGGIETVDGQYSCENKDYESVGSGVSSNSICSINTDRFSFAMTPIEGVKYAAEMIAFLHGGIGFGPAELGIQFSVEILDAFGAFGKSSEERMFDSIAKMFALQWACTVSYVNMIAAGLYDAIWDEDLRTMEYFTETLEKLYDDLQLDSTDDAVWDTLTENTPNILYVLNRMAEVINSAAAFEDAPRRCRGLMPFIITTISHTLLSYNMYFEYEEWHNEFYNDVTDESDGFVDNMQNLLDTYLQCLAPAYLHGLTESTYYSAASLYAEIDIYVDAKLLCFWIEDTINLAMKNTGLSVDDVINYRFTNSADSVMFAFIDQCLNNFENVDTFLANYIDGEFTRNSYYDDSHFDHFEMRMSELFAIHKIPTVLVFDQDKCGGRSWDGPREVGCRSNDFNWQVTFSYMDNRVFFVDYDCGRGLQQNTDLYVRGCRPRSNSDYFTQNIECNDPANEYVNGIRYMVEYNSYEYNNGDPELDEPLMRGLQIICVNNNDRVDHYTLNFFGNRQIDLEYEFSPWYICPFNKQLVVNDFSPINACSYKYSHCGGNNIRFRRSLIPDDALLELSCV